MLFGQANQVDFYDLTDRAVVAYADEPDPAADVETHRDLSIRLHIDPAKLPTSLAGATNLNQTVKDTADAYHRLVAVVKDRLENYKSLNELYGTAGGFMLNAAKYLTGVDEPIRAWTLKQCHLESIDLDDDHEVLGGLIVDVYLHAIIHDA